MRDPRVRKLSFTGSTEVGRIPLRQAADSVVNCSMELGGNAPFVVLADADLDEAVSGAMVAKLRSGGEACTAARLTVERWCMPVGGSPDRPGFFYAPTVLGSVPADAGILQTEIFGPVAPVVAFDDVDEAVRLTNDTDYGLVSYVYTRDLAMGLRVGEALEAGINRPTQPTQGTPQSASSVMDRAVRLADRLPDTVAAMESSRLESPMIGTSRRG